MAQVFKNARAALTTSLADIYTCPANATAIIIHCQIANIDGVNNANVDAGWTDASAGNVLTHWVQGVNVPANAALAPIKGKPILEAGDKVQAKASADGDLELSLGILELT